MANQTCGKCYKTTEYKYQKAKFCSHCGTDFSNVFATKVETRVPQRQLQVFSQYEEEDEKPKNWNLKASVIMDDDNGRGVSMKDLLEGRVSIGARPPENRSAGEVMSDFKKKASSIGKPNEID